jgi:hypothetical protein
MYSTLNHQENLIRVHLDRRFRLKALLQWLTPGSNLYFLARNPYMRILSFYKDKFLKAESNRIYSEKYFNKKWQTSTEYFFPYLNLSVNSDSDIISKRLMNTSFDEFMSILPKVYMKDAHMRPQYKSNSIVIRRLGIRFHVPFKFKKIFKMEKEQDKDELKSLFNLNLNERKNTSTQIKVLNVWSSEAVDLVLKLYYKDFKILGYHKDDY